MKNLMKIDNFLDDFGLFKKLLAKHLETKQKQKSKFRSMLLGTSGPGLLVLNSVSKYR